MQNKGLIGKKSVHKLKLSLPGSDRSTVKSTEAGLLGESAQGQVQRQGMGRLW